MRIAICEDSAYDAELLIRLLREYENTAVTDTYPAAEQLLDAYSCGERYDLLFMDIQLPGMNGFEAAKVLHNEYHDEKPLIVFLTLTDKYVFDAYNVGWDYICKPIDEERMQSLHVRAQSELSHRKIAIQTKEGFTYLESKDIIFAESGSGTVDIVTKQGVHNTRMSLENFEELLVNRPFFRVHRCCIVNLRHVTKFTQVDVFLSESNKVPLSRNRRVQFIECLENFHRGNYYG